MKTKRGMGKVIWIAALIMVMMFAMAACGSQTEEQGSDQSAQHSDQVAQQSSEETAQQSGEQGSGEMMVIDTVDFEGNPVTNADFADAKVIMVNFWEPWCGPCVGEVGALEKLYENYRDDGLVILGPFFSTDMDEEAASIIEENGLTYPILRGTDEMMEFMTDYYPTTIFLDGSGAVISEEPVIGAQDYKTWDAEIKGYLGK